MPTPSFAQLFSRSRHARFALPEEEKRNHERLEEFAVAAVGFALSHDIQFRKKFLRDFADIEDSAEKYRLSLQDRQCADLALKNYSDGRVVVCEFKVFATLGKHQNPWDGNLRPATNSSFWKAVSDGKNGYGHELTRNYSEFSEIHYIVIQQKEDGRNEEPYIRSGKTFHFKSRSWKRLLEPKTELEKDLVISLGELGITELKDYRMKDLSITKDQLDAFFKGTDAFHLLMHIGKKLGLRASKVQRDLAYSCTEGSDRSKEPFFQLNVGIVRNQMGSLGQTRSSFKEAEFGYYKFEGKQFRAEVWFYGDDRRKRQLQERLNKEMKGTVSFEGVDGDKSVIRVVKSKTTPKDLEWFLKVLGVA